MEGSSQNQVHGLVFPAERMISLLRNQDHWHAEDHHAVRHDRGYNCLESYLVQDGAEILTVTENDDIRDQPAAGRCHGLVLFRPIMSAFPYRQIFNVSLMNSYCYFLDLYHMKHPSPQQFHAHAKWRQPG